MAAAASALLATDVSFSSLGLDERLVHAARKLGFHSPTLVQQHMVDVAGKGRDVLVRARTGSGKTAAFVLCVLQRLLSDDAAARGAAAGAASGGDGGGRGGANEARVVVVVPSAELVGQTVAVFTAFLRYTQDVVSVAGVGDAASSGVSEDAARLRRQTRGVVVGTARALVLQERSGVLSFRSVVVLVVDEADSVLSVAGGIDDVRYVVSKLPKILQTFLVSATLSPALEDLKRVVLHHPAVLRLDEGDAAAGGALAQFFVRIGDKDRFLLLYALLKLRLIASKAIFFVNTVDEGYRLKLFLEQFSIASAVLNAELPANSRSHVLKQYNAGVFSYLIATDEALGGDDEVPDGGDEDREGARDDAAVGDPAAPGKRKLSCAAAERRPAKRARSGDPTFGVARGVDFVGVGTVVNVDCPPSLTSYVHRVGRTARGGASGSALTLLSRSSHDRVLKAIQEFQLPDARGQPQPSELPFNMAEVEGFRYRVMDVLHKVTRLAVREARAEAVKDELLNSEKLKAHFEDNARELELLKHAKVRVDKVKRHLADVPFYLLPASIRSAAARAGGGLSASGDTTHGRPRGRGPGHPRNDESNPLKTFAYNASRAAELGVSSAGRNAWKMRHHKGKWASRQPKGPKASKQMSKT